MKVTADTITLDQIRELRDTQSPVTGNVAWACAVALGESGGSPSPEYIHQCRGLCAEAWNARNGGGS